MTKLVLDRVFKRFDTTEIIHGVSFDINPGEFVVFVGPSGCGKSTLFAHDCRIGNGNYGKHPDRRPANE
jgi:ABC-type sugar transport system ATPase subunit